MYTHTYTHRALSGPRPRPLPGRLPSAPAEWVPSLRGTPGLR